jgi:radical SAM protein with 4Fe4S-binding SPASM domain
LKFRKIYLEITNACNLVCEFCPGTTRPIEHIDLGRAERYIATLAPLSGILHLHIMGEPLHHPEFSSILTLCAAHGAKVNLVTNGTLLSHHTALLLNSPAIQQISISLHSLEANAGQNVEPYTSRIIEFIFAQKIHPNISLRLWNREHSLNSPATQFFLTALCTSGHFNGTPDQMIRTLQAKGALRISDYLFINTAERFEWPNLEAPDLGESGRCPGLNDQLAVLVDGTVVPCCLDRNGVTALGNLEEQTLAEILAAPRAQTMRDGFGRGHITEPLCRRCTYRLRFDKK